MEAQEQLPTIPIPLSRAGQAAPMSLSQPRSAPVPPAVSPVPSTVPHPAVLCQQLRGLAGASAPVLAIPLAPGEVAEKDVTPPPRGFPGLSPQDLCLLLCLEAACGAASWAELPGHPSRSESPFHERQVRNCSRSRSRAEGARSARVALAPRWHVAPLGFAGSRQGRVFLALPSSGCGRCVAFICCGSIWSLGGRRHRTHVGSGHHADPKIPGCWGGPVGFLPSC